MASLFKRNGIWYVRYKDRSGSWISESCGKDAKKPEAEHLKNKYAAEEFNNYHKALIRVTDVSIIDALKNFKTIQLPNEPNRVISSVRREQAVVDTIMTYLDEHKIASFKDFNKEQITAFVKYREQVKKRKAKTIGEELRMLNKFFKYAIAEGYCYENPAQDVVAPKLEKKNPRFFSDSELSTIFFLAPEPYKTIFKFLFLTGLRIGELANLKWDDFDEHQRLLTLRVVLGNKKKDENTLPLNNDAYAILLERKKLRKSENEGKQEEDIDCIFRNDAGLKLDNDNLYRNLKRVLSKMNVRKASPHTFRHTMASHLVMKGVPIYTVSKLLRHESVKDTEIYAHLAPNVLKTSIELLRINECTQHLPLAG